MIREIEIKNFRGIERMKISAAKRLNIIVGSNGTGKTAFLEAIFLASGQSPEIIQRTKVWRGRETLSQGSIDSLPGSMDSLPGSMDSLQDALWGDTFRDLEKATGSVHLVGDEGEDETRSIEFSKNSNTETVISSGSKTTSFDWKFEYNSASFGNQTANIRVDENGLSIGSVQTSMFCAFIGARSNVSEAQSANLYSKLRIADKAEAFEKAILDEFPILQSLDIESPGGTPVIYGRLKSGRRLPLTMISSGINHLAAILLALTYKPRSILLLDEIENGFFHDRFGSIWNRLYEVSTAMEGQIFATTHSMECLQALADQMKNREDEVRFFRSRYEDDKVLFEELPGKALFGALKLGEVR